MRKAVLDLDFDPRDFSQFDCVTDKIPAKEQGPVNSVLLYRFDARIFVRDHGPSFLNEVPTLLAAAASYVRGGSVRGLHIRRLPSTGRFLSRPDRQAAPPPPLPL
jgi:hypothetical protein